MAFEPREMVASRRAFGNVSRTIAPAEGVEPTDHRYRAAMLQHFLARFVEEELKVRDLSLPAFLDSVDDAPGLSPDRQRRVLRGETSATYADLAFWSGHFPAIAPKLAAYIESWATPPVAPTEPEMSKVQATSRPPMR